MVNELSEAFLYAHSAFELWKEVTERYGHSNGPLIYQLERELSKITQGNLTIAAFFNKLKRCWDELQNLNGLPVCECGKMNEFEPVQEPAPSSFPMFGDTEADEVLLAPSIPIPTPMPNTQNMESPINDSPEPSITHTKPPNVPQPPNVTQPPNVAQTNPPIPSRKSIRASTKPAWLRDFKVN
ncbi:hypothetical protein CTI12_AA321590 [Artemisia annua]|uniref:Uncharacterized protein n=1 Tax=Artemisia annua TaxID=35608 RepID=A0A2U1N0H3_ARTAN|nr:hypothetical protein CTI12_AA321590 [Artemisia annua]